MRGFCEEIISKLREAEIADTSDGRLLESPFENAIDQIRDRVIGPTTVGWQAAMLSRSGSTKEVVMELFAGYSARFIMATPPSDREMAGNAQVPSPDLNEQRIALGRPHGGEMSDGPDGKPDQAQAEAHGPGEGAVEDRDRSRSAAEHDVFGQRAMNRDRESRHGV